VLETGNDVPQLFQGFLVLFELRLELFQRLVGDLSGHFRGQARFPILLPGFQICLTLIQILGRSRQLRPSFRGQYGRQKLFFI